MAANISKLKKDNNLVMLHLADSKLNYNHLDYWINTLIESNQPFSCLVRDIALL